jgi:hypothetical protein
MSYNFPKNHSCKCKRALATKMKNAVACVIRAGFLYKRAHMCDVINLCDAAVREDETQRRVASSERALMCVNREEKCLACLKL